MRKLIIAAVLLCATALPAVAKETQNASNYQTMFLANMVDGLCHVKEQSGVTTMNSSGHISTTSPVMTDEEKNQCGYVRTGLAVKCFEHGTCPSYEDWLHAGGVKH